MRPERKGQRVTRPSGRQATYTIPTTPPKDMRGYVPAVEAAKTLRIRRLVLMRLLTSGKLRGVCFLVGRQFRYYVAPGEVERAAREKPWKPWAMRVYKH